MAYWFIAAVIPVAQANKTLEADLKLLPESRTSDRSCPTFSGLNRSKARFVWRTAAGQSF